MMDITDILITIAITTVVGFAILLYQRKMGQKIDKLIIKQNQIIEDDFNRERAWKEEWGKRILEDLNSIKNFHQILERWLVDYMNNRSDVTKETLVFSAERLGNIIDFHIQRLKENIPKIEKYLKDPRLSTLIIKQADVYPTPFKVLNQEWIWNDDGLTGEIQSIEGTIKMLNDVSERMKTEINLIREDTN